MERGGLRPLVARPQPHVPRAGEGAEPLQATGRLGPEAPGPLASQSAPLETPCAPPAPPQPTDAGPGPVSLSMEWAAQPREGPSAARVLLGGSAPRTGVGPMWGLPGWGEGRRDPERALFGRHMNPETSRLRLGAAFRGHVPKPSTPRSRAVAWRAAEPRAAQGAGPACRGEAEGRGLFPGAAFAPGFAGWRQPQPRGHCGHLVPQWHLGGPRPCLPAGVSTPTLRPA